MTAKSEDEESDLDQEFMNAMNGDPLDDITGNEIIHETAREDSEDEADEDDDDDNGSTHRHVNELEYRIASRSSCNFLALLGEDLLIRICSTMSASNLCELAKTCQW